MDGLPVLFGLLALVALIILIIRFAASEAAKSNESERTQRQQLLEYQGTQPDYWSCPYRITRGRWTGQQVLLGIYRAKKMIRFILDYKKKNTRRDYGFHEIVDVEHGYSHPDTPGEATHIITTIITTDPVLPSLSLTDSDKELFDNLRSALKR